MWWCKLPTQRQMELQDTYIIHSDINNNISRTQRRGDMGDRKVQHQKVVKPRTERQPGAQTQQF